MIDSTLSILPGGTATIIAAFISAFFAAHMHFFKWLSRKFETIFDKIEDLGKEYRSLLAVHEGHDQRRHEENLDRFQQLNVSLARLEENVEASKDQPGPGSQTSVSRSKSS